MKLRHQSWIISICIILSLIVFGYASYVGNELGRINTHQDDSSRIYAQETGTPKKPASAPEQPQEKAAPPKIDYYKKYPDRNRFIMLPSKRIDQRRLLILSLRNARERGDYKFCAILNSFFAGEAFTHAARTLDFWMTEYDPETFLFAEFLRRENRKWSTQNSGADLFPFLVISASFLNEKHLDILNTALERERQIGGKLAQSIDLSTNKPLDEKLDKVIFGASEYCKDGLLAILEIRNLSQFTERMLEIIDAIFEAAPVKSDFGLLPSKLAEVNGEMLQVLCRLYWMTGDEKYLLWAERIGNAYLKEAIPKNHFMPPYEWDFTTHGTWRADCQLRDHGNEIIPGLTELFLIQVYKGRENEEEYFTVLKTMLDRLLEFGRNEDGLWYNMLNVRSGKVVNKDLCDNWGYLFNGYYTFYLACKKANRLTEKERSVYIDAIKKALSNLHKYKSYEWENVDQDGYADSIESALYMLNMIRDDTAIEWTDDEISIMFAKQSPDGYVDGYYLDGNFIRTVLLYAFSKTQGTYIKPWRQDVFLGAYRDGENLFIHVENVEAWKGILCFDIPRYKEFLNLPVNYPRVNGWPEWYVVETEKNYQISSPNSKTGEIETKTMRGNVLRKGIELDLKPNSSIDLVIKPKE